MTHQPPHNPQDKATEALKQIKKGEVAQKPPVNVKGLLDKYIVGHEQEFLAYAKACAEAEKAAGDKNAEELQKTTDKAHELCDKLVRLIEPKQIEMKGIDPKVMAHEIANEKKDLYKALERVDPAIRDKKLELIANDLAKVSKGMFSYSPTHRVNQVRDAQQAGDGTALTAALGKLRKKIVSYTSDKNLSEKDIDDVLVLMSHDPSKVAQTHKAANPISQGIKDNVGRVVEDTMEPSSLASAAGIPAPVANQIGKAAKSMGVV